MSEDIKQQIIDKLNVRIAELERELDEANNAIINLQNEIYDLYGWFTATENK